MFAQAAYRSDFADTRASDTVMGIAGSGRFEPVDALAEMASADEADRRLLHLVMYAAAATLTLALAASLGG